jgi:hypothetical protein
MQITINGRWIKYPPDWPTIGKVRNNWTLTIGKSNDYTKRLGYEYFYYDGFECYSFGFYFFYVAWATGYETHKDNKANEQWKSK